MDNSFDSVGEHFEWPMIFDDPAKPATSVDASKQWISPSMSFVSQQDQRFGSTADHELLNQQYYNYMWPVPSNSSTVVPILTGSDGYQSSSGEIVPFLGCPPSMGSIATNSFQTCLTPQSSDGIFRPNLLSQPYVAQQSVLSYINYAPKVVRDHRYMSTRTTTRKTQKDSTILPTVRRRAPKYLPPSSKPAFRVMKMQTQKSAVKHKTPEQRARAARTRESGACERHKQLKKPCNPDWQPYVKCPDVPRDIVTFLFKPTEAVLFRSRPTSGHPLKSQRVELYKRGLQLALEELKRSQQNDRKVITLSQRFGYNVDVEVECFVAKEGDKLDHIWFMDGQQETIVMPHYCVSFTRDAGTALAKYMRVAKADYLQHIINNSGPIVRDMLEFARNYQRSTKSTLVNNAINLLSITRFIEIDWSIEGSQDLGIPHIEDQNCPWYGLTPVTPTMDTQLDQIIIQQFLNPLRHRILKELQSKLYTQDSAHLLEVWLTVFILATNIEWLLRHSHKNALRYNAKLRYNSPGLIQAYINGFNILLSHFHYLTKKSFVSAGGSKQHGLKEFTKEQLNFVNDIKTRFAGMEEHLEGLRKREEYEAELYWSHQLFRKDWKPESPSGLNWDPIPSKTTTT